MVGDAHNTGFMVAGATKADVLGDMHTAINKAIETGSTLQDFRKDFDDIVAKTGWEYNGSRNWRTKIIYDTNMRTAYMAGKWQQFQENKKFYPYLRYSAVNDEHTRPEHAQWDGLIFPIDHEFWKTHYPPNGWNCRCSVESISKREMDAEGLKESEMPNDGTYEWVNPATGEITHIPNGIDAGFNYTPGRQESNLKEIVQSKTQTLPKPIGNQLSDYLKQFSTSWLINSLTKFIKLLG